MLRAYTSQVTSDKSGGKRSRGAEEKRSGGERRLAVSVSPLPPCPSAPLPALLVTFDQAAGDEVLVFDFDELRVVIGAFGFSNRAARAKATTRRRLDRRRNLACKRQPFAPRVGVGHGDRRE